MLGANTTGTCSAAAAIAALPVASKPVVPITIALPAARASARCASVPSGRVKSITQSAAAIAAAASSVMSTPVATPAISPASRPMKGVSLRSKAAASTTPSSFSAASISILPMRPDAPAIATRIWDIGLFSCINGPAQTAGPEWVWAPPQRPAAGGISTTRERCCGTASGAAEAAATSPSMRSSTSPAKKSEITRCCASPLPGRKR